MRPLAFAAWIMLAWDLGRLHQYAVGGGAGRIAAGALLTVAAFVLAYGGPEVRRRRLLRSLRPQASQEKP